MLLLLSDFFLELSGLLLEFFDAWLDWSLINFIILWDRKAFKLTPYLFDHAVASGCRIFGDLRWEILVLESGPQFFLLFFLILLFLGLLL